MQKVFHAYRLTLKEINTSNDSIYCILEQGKNTCKGVYYTKQKQNNEYIFKSLISDNTYDKNTIENNNIKIYKVSDKNKINYIQNNIETNEEDIKNIDELFIKTYIEFE